ncbi:MAG: hypothetical protein GYA02_12775 [Clostridiaceae bacterium]|nr:hypothetical protein [Clostridiaceae bacterium]
MKVFPDEVIVIVQDCDPGIADAELALKDRYSTASDYVLARILVQEEDFPI